MKAEEFRVGDWVKIKDFPMRFESARFTEHHWVRSLCEYSPIPITGAMLAANGFGCPSGLSKVASRYVYATDISDIVIEYTFYNVPNDSVRSLLQIANTVEDGVNSIHILNITNVHELQHALRLCGLGDMADNFKIK